MSACQSMLLNENSSLVETFYKRPINQQLNINAMEIKMETPYDDRVKQQKDLIRLYVDLVSDKPGHRFDPKLMIFSVLPERETLYASYQPNCDYSISQSIEEFGKLEISEHRFVNYLKFNPFHQNEIDKVFEVFNKFEIDPKWEYTIDQVWFFYGTEKRKGFSLPFEENDEVPILTQEELLKVLEKI